MLIHHKVWHFESVRAQAWGMDLTVAILIFSSALIAFYIYTLNHSNDAQDVIEGMSYDGGIIADAILSEGYPSDWNPSNVVMVGILSNNKINDTKIERFYDIAGSEYEKTKNLFNTGYNYYFSLSKNIILSTGEIEGIGKKPASYNNLFKVTRFVVYKDAPIEAYIYIWN